jgi:hypothetical protein
VIEVDDKEKTVDFGAKGMGDFTIYSKSNPEEAKNHRERYIARHAKMGEDWNDPLTPGFWSRWLLWEKPTIQESLKFIKKRFNL